MLDFTTSMILVAASATLCAATWGACHWWYGRRIAAATARLGKMEQAREFSIQQNMQARKQIEWLQKELAAQQRVTMQAKAGPVRSVNLDAAARSAGDAASGGERLPANGFADTQLMPGRG